MTKQQIILTLFKKYPKYFNNLLFTFYPITDEQVEQHIQFINWEALSRNKNRQWNLSFIHKHQDKLNWHELSDNVALPWSELFFETYRNKFNRLNICLNPALPWSKDFILKHVQYWNYHHLVQNASIPWTQELVLHPKIVDKNLMHVQGDNLWTEEFLISHARVLPWQWLCYNPHINWTQQLISKLSPHWLKYEKNNSDMSASPWKGLCSNGSIPWNKSWIKKYQTSGKRKYGISWASLSGNPNLSWQSENLLEEYASKWDWELLSLNNGVAFTEEQLEKYKDLIVWKSNDSSFRCISSNTSLSWSISLIKKYIDRWDWFLLCKNPAINWSEELIEEFKDYIHWNGLQSNQNLPWSLEFIIKHEADLDFNAISWDNKFNEYLWNQVFRDNVDAGMVKDYLQQDIQK